jgi:hypothetical protein
MTGFQPSKAISVNTILYKVSVANASIKVLGPLIRYENLYTYVNIYVSEVLSFLNRFFVAFPCNRTDSAPTMKPKITIEW